MTLRVNSDWQKALRNHRDAIENLIASRSTDELPPTDQLFRALDLPLHGVKVVILGQDPYPTPGHANGLAFSVNPDVSPIPPTLRNIFLEYTSDTGYPMPTTGDLAPWVEQGVLLLNRTLSVSPHKAGSLRSAQWRQISDAILTALVGANARVVAILWGKDAAAEESRFASSIISPHPSPLAAYRGFFGSRPFSRANALLVQSKIEPIEWRLP